MVRAHSAPRVIHRSHLSRYAAIARLAYRYGRRELLAHAEATDLLTGDFPTEPPSEATRARADRLAHDLERMLGALVLARNLLARDE